MSERLLSLLSDRNGSNVSYAIQLMLCFPHQILDFLMRLMALIQKRCNFCSFARGFNQSLSAIKNHVKVEISKGFAHRPIFLSPFLNWLVIPPLTHLLLLLHDLHAWKIPKTITITTFSSSSLSSSSHSISHIISTYS
jgi:hypothetical protein